MAATEQSFPASTALATGGGRIITSPFQFVADQDTFLRVVSCCSVTGVTIAVQGRRLDQLSQIQPITETHAPNADRTVKSQDYVLGVGAILNLTVFAAAGTPLIGQCYVMVQLLRNFGGTAIVLGTLLAGYVTATQALGFPGSPIQSSTDGEPAVRNIIGTTPAAGTELSETVPAGARWELITFYAVFGAFDPSPTTRAPFLRISSGGVRFGNYFMEDTVQGSATEYSTAQNMPFINTIPPNFANQNIPQRQFLRANDTITTLTIHMGPLDQWGPVRYQVREWLEV